MVGFIRMGLFILTYYYNDSRLFVLIIWARISNYFDGGSLGCRARFESFRNRSRETWPFQDNFEAGINYIGTQASLPYLKEAITRSTITVLHPLPHVTISHVRMCENFSMFLARAVLLSTGN